MVSNYATKDPKHSIRNFDKSTVTIIGDFERIGDRLFKRRFPSKQVKQKKLIPQKSSFEKTISTLTNI